MNADRAEEIEHAVEAITKEETRGSVALWFAVLGSPLAWGGHLVANYTLEEWFACSPSAQDPGEILGFGVRSVSIVINTAMVVVALASLVVAYRCWRKIRPDTGDARSERARWMGFAGIVEGVLFLGIILLGYLPAITLGTCRTTP